MSEMGNSSRTGFFARSMLRALIAVVLLSSSAAAAADIRFIRDGIEVRRLDLDTLKQTYRAEVVTIDDPYYGARKSFRGFRLHDVLEAGFGEKVAMLAGEDFFFQALDGYVKLAEGKTLAEEGGFVTFADVGRERAGEPGWEPIDRRQVDPGPFYVVWAKPAQRDVHRYPWPYQLSAIEIVRFDRRYPFTLPSRAPLDSPSWTGFAIFRRECISCHSINGQGGKVGPDLNVPQSIVEYRPAEQLKQFIRDPGTFRHTSMPAHLHLSPQDLDALIAYFEAMKAQKHDPKAP